MKISRLIILAAVFALVGCSRSSVVTIITINRSSVGLSNITVSVSQFSMPIGSLAPGAEHRLAVHPRGDPKVRLVFDAAGHHIDSGEQGDFLAGGVYHLVLAVQPDMKVVVSTNLPSY